MRFPKNLQFYLEEQRQTLNTIGRFSFHSATLPIGALIRMMPLGCFITVTSLVDKKFDVVIGVKQALGFMESAFTIEKYYERLPSPYREMVLLYGRSTYQSLMENKSLSTNTELLKSCEYSIEIPMMHRDNYRVHFQRSSRIFEVNKDGRILSNINFHFPSNHSVPPITCPLIQSYLPNKSIAKLGEQIIGMTVPQIRAYIDGLQKGKNKFLTETQEEIALLQSLGRSAKDIALLRKRERSTINDHSKTILLKVQELFNYSFTSSIVASTYLSQLRLLNNKNLNYFSC